MRMRWWDQCRQPVDELQRGEHQLGAAIRLRFGQVVHQPVRVDGLQPLHVDDRPGVTRDRREADADFGDLALTLIDTAGYETGDLDALETAMRAQTEAAIRESDFVLFVIDARAGVTPLDESIADVVRGFDRPVVLAANKCEGKAGDDGVLEAWALGFGEPIPTSAEHNEGMSDLYRAFADIIETLAEAKSGGEDDDAVAGLHPTVDGRGALDDKGSLVAILAGFEQGGDQIAAATAAALRRSRPLCRRARPRDDIAPGIHRSIYRSGRNTGLSHRGATRHRASLVARWPLFRDAKRPLESFRAADFSTRPTHA